MSCMVLKWVLQAKWPLGASLGQAGCEVVAWWALLVIRQWAKGDGPIIKKEHEHEHKHKHETKIK